MLTAGIAVYVAMETSKGQVEIELAPEVEIPTAWSKRAPWPRCLSRWPSADRAKCIKVPVSRPPGRAQPSQPPTGHLGCQPASQREQVSPDPGFSSGGPTGERGAAPEDLLDMRVPAPPLICGTRLGGQAPPPGFNKPPGDSGAGSPRRKERTQPLPLTAHVPGAGPEAPAVSTRGAPPALGLAPRPVDAAEMAFSSFLLRPASSFSRPRPPLPPVVWILPVGPLALSLAAELPAGRAGAAGAPGRGRGLPPALLPGPAADEGGRLVSRAEACDHIPPPAGECAAGATGVGPLCVWLGLAWPHGLGLCVCVRCIQDGRPVSPFAVPQRVTHGERETSCKSAHNSPGRGTISSASPSLSPSPSFHFLSLCLSFFPPVSFYLSLLLFHSTNHHKCPLCARNPAER